MDFVQDYFPQALYYYTAYYRPYEAYIRPLRRVLYYSQSYFYRYFFPYLYPTYTLLQRILGGSGNGSALDFASLALLAVLAVVSLKLLDMVRRTILYWIGVAVRLVLWLTVVAFGVYVWQRGVEASVEDLGWVVGYLAGLGNEGERIGKSRAARREGDARRIPRGQPRPRGRTRGAGWS